MMIVELLRSYVELVWHMIWPLAFGFTLSAMIRSYIPDEAVIRTMGSNSIGSAVMATLFGTVSSVCNYATLGMGHTLRLKGASWPSTMVFMIASTNLGITMLIAVAGFLGADFLKAMLLGALLFLISGYLFTRIMRMPAPTIPIIEKKGRLRRTPWMNACTFLNEDWDMTRRDISTGLIVATFVSVLIPSKDWAIIFMSPQTMGEIAWLWNAVVGVLIAILTFGCSIGNVAIAGVMWWYGVPVGGVMAFVLGSLLTMPMIKMTFDYYGKKVGQQYVVILTLSAMMASVVLEYISLQWGLELSRSNPMDHMDHADQISVLVANLLMGGFALTMYYRGKVLSKMIM